jgi:hypothetical protein
MGALTKLKGNNNWITGANHNIKGNNIRMFGPNADPKYFHGVFTA